MANFVHRAPDTCSACRSNHGRDTAMTLDVTDKLSKQFQDLARRRRAARGRISA